MWKPDNKLLLCIEVIFSGETLKSNYCWKKWFLCLGTAEGEKLWWSFCQLLSLKVYRHCLCNLFKWELENRNICLTVDSPVWLCQFAALVKIQTKCISNIFMPGKRKIGNIEQMFCSICFSCFSAVFHRSSLHTSSFGRNLTSKLQNCERTYIQKSEKVRNFWNQLLQVFHFTFTENQLIAFLKWNLFSWF